MKVLAGQRGGPGSGAGGHATRRTGPTRAAAGHTLLTHFSTQSQTHTHAVADTRVFTLRAALLNYEQHYVVTTDNRLARLEKE